MLLAALRRSGGSLILTVPSTYVEQNRLSAGSALSIDIVGDELKIRPKRTRRTLAELLAATPRGLHRATGWDELAPGGTEW